MPEGHIIWPSVLESDALYDAPDHALADAYAYTVIALLEASGMATWAYTTEREDFTLESFRTVAPATPQDRARTGRPARPGRAAR